MSPADVADLLTLIADRAPALRKAGVTELELECFSVKLAPHIEPDVTPATSADENQEAEALPPLDDAETYGLPPGSPVPGFAALREKRQRDR